MKFVFRAIFLFSFLFSGSLSQAQSADSSHLRISLITCGPGKELYSVWGHTAIRVIDSSSGKDIVFNYGTFNAYDPYFYLKFTRGIMRYALAADNFNDFLQEYKEDQRNVSEQVLGLNDLQKNRLFNLLKTNALEANRYYNYQFYADNCTTRAKAIINESTNHTIVFKPQLPVLQSTYRQLIHANLFACHRNWDSFGIDLLLGSNLDKKISFEQFMFLPDFLMIGLDWATLEDKPLVSETNMILDHNRINRRKELFTPLHVFSCLAVCFVLLSFSKNAKTKKVLRIADSLFFFILGCLGLLILAVWLGRVDDVCRNNLNILWAWPSHAFVVFLFNKNSCWRKVYFLIAGVIASLVLLGWHWLPQQLNSATVPLLMITTLRGYLISAKS